MNMLDVEDLLHRLCTTKDTGARLRAAGLERQLERDVWELLEMAYHIGLAEGRAEGEED